MRLLKDQRTDGLSCHDAAFIGAQYVRHHNPPLGRWIPGSSGVADDSQAGGDTPLPLVCVFRLDGQARPVMLDGLYNLTRRRAGPADPLDPGHVMPRNWRVRVNWHNLVARLLGRCREYRRYLARLKRKRTLQARDGSAGHPCDADKLEHALAEEVPRAFATPSDGCLAESPRRDNVAGPESNVWDVPKAGDGWVRTHVDLVDGPR
jgi:hypothetical protein